MKMSEQSIDQIFAFLLCSGKFQRGEAREGAGFREAYFCSPALVLRIAEQREFTSEGESSTCLCYLIDPSNPQRWCMFEKAADKMLGVTINGSENVEELAGNVDAYIGAILAKIDIGGEAPFDDFSRYT